MASGSKEVRALFPMWLACVIAVALHNQMAGSFLPTFSVLAYGFGSIALGAQSIGHEYGYGTLGMLLSQPADRRRMFLVKQGVLASLLIALAVVAWLTLLDGGLLRPTPRDIVGDYEKAGRLVLVVGLSGLFIAPALTMVTRSWIAGVVFTIGLVGTLRVVAQLTGWARFGALESGAADRFTEALFWPAMLGVWAVGAVASWRLFLRLEASDGQGTEIQLSRWLPGSGAEAAPAPARRRGAVWQLVMKELHLQQMAFFLTAAYIVGLLLLSFVGNIEPQLRRDLAGPITVIHIAGVTTLIGSMASAEERQLGSLQWQLLMPLAAWRQWTVKVIVVLFLALALGVGVPSMLTLIAPALPQLRPELDVIVLSILLAACGSLYVSSLCTGGVRAMVVSLPALLATASFSRLVLDGIEYVFYSRFFSPFALARGNPGRYYVPWMPIVIVIAILGGTCLVMAYRNHRSADRPWTRIVAQVMLFAAILSAALTALVLLGV